jgi:hypothetical protein
MAETDATTGSTSLRARLLRPSFVIFKITAIGLAAAWLTLRTVRESVTPPPLDGDPTPLGYTWSLGLFILPFLYLVLWFALHPEYKIQRRAFFTTLAILIPVGFLLDIFFAHTFFTFENTGAVTGIEVPGRGGPIPIEEFVFYISGFLFVLLLYVWADEFWMERYNLPHSHALYTAPRRALAFHGDSVTMALILLGMAVVYKKLVADDPEGFPWYWAYLLAGAFVPSAGFYRAARPLINWRAFSFTFVVTLLISLLWEASLASPYGWWGYKAEAMMGIFIAAWSQLPIEAVFVWLAVTYTTIIIYEVVTLWHASGAKLGEVLFGRR